MLLKLDFESEIPIYLQLKAQIIEGIARGSLKAGEALPSVRQMASDVGINLHTVNKVYTILKQDGFILVHRQKGVVIAPAQERRLPDEYLAQLQTQLETIIAEAHCRGMTSMEFDKICDSIFSNLKNGGENI